MFFRMAADAIVLIHFAYVMFVILAVPIVFIGAWRNWQWVRNRWFRLAHVAMIMIVVIESWAGITCPLTTLEKEFRGAAGDQTYDGDFLGNVVHDLLFVEAPPWVFVAGYTAFAILVLSTFWIVPPRWKQTGRPAVRSPKSSGETPSQVSG
ncbi:MAG: DUF2784 domain-containing protein [Planctomycetota bacterium]